MKLLSLFIVLSCLAGSAFAAIRVDPVTYKVGDTTLHGFVSYDDAVTGKRPGVVVVHEWWGLTDYAKMRGHMLAEAGYVAFNADMYGDGKTTDHPKDAAEWSAAVMKNQDVANARFAAAVEQLKKNPHVDPNHIAAVGYCFGGSVVLLQAMGGADLDGVVSFHGGLPAQPATGKITASILVCNGAADSFAPPELIQTFQKNLTDAHADWEFISYGDARHAFTNPDAGKYGIPNLAYNEKADKRSWQTALNFLAEVTK